MNNVKQNEEAKIGLVNQLKKEIPNCTIVLDVDENERVVGYCAVNLDGQAKFHPKKGAMLVINGSRLDHEEKIMDARKSHLNDVKYFKDKSTNNYRLSWLLAAIIVIETVILLTR